MKKIDIDLFYKNGILNEKDLIRITALKINEIIDELKLEKKDPMREFFKLYLLMWSENLDEDQQTVAGEDWDLPEKRASELAELLVADEELFEVLDRKCREIINAEIGYIEEED